MSNISQPIEKYRTYMREIRFRIIVIDRSINELHKGGALTGFRESDYELIYLQLRQCLELTMFASLAAHYHHGIQLNKKITEKEFNATILLKFIRAKNKNCYPQPVEANDGVDKNGQFLVKDIHSGYLTEVEFCELYGKCGFILHAQRKPKFTLEQDRLIEEASSYRDRLVKLLNVHWVHLTDRDAIRVVMLDKDTGDVSINEMREVT